MPKRVISVLFGRRLFAGFLSVNFLLYTLLTPFSSAQGSVFPFAGFFPHRNDIQYDSVGRVTSYHQSVTQVEHYEYVKQVQKGLKRKNAKKSTTESVTTESDVQVLEYDGFGRQVHTITTSQRNDRNKVWTQTDARVKSFDDHGRALEVDRQTQSKATVEKKSGGLAAQIGSVVAVGVLCMTGVGIFVAAIVGAGLLAATSLGGQVINSFSHTVALNQYKADGSLDEEATKAKTTTLEEYSYQQGTNFGDKVMTATDIAVAVVAVFATVMSGGTLLPLLVVAMGSFAYQGSRQGISINDFEANPDREQARASRMLVATSVASVATGGLTSGMAGGWLKGLVFASVNTGVAAVGGADQETLMQVAAISFVTGALMGNAEKSANLATQATFSGAGTLISQTGMSFGKANQRTTWGLIGGTIGASGGDLSIAGMSAAKNTFLTLYSKKNDGSGGTDQNRMNQGFILSSWTELLGTLSSLGMESYGRGKEPEEKLKGWAAVMDGAKKFAQGIGNWLVSPFKGLIRAPQTLRSNLIGMPLRPGTPAVAPRGSHDRRAPTDTETMNKEPLLDPSGTRPNSDSPANLPGVSKQAIDKLPGAEPLNEIPKLKPSLDLLPLPGLRLLPGLLSPRVDAGGESPADTLTARLMAYLYAWTPGNHTVTLLASAMGMNAYGEGRDYDVVGGNTTVKAVKTAVHVAANGTTSPMRVGENPIVTPPTSQASEPEQTGGIHGLWKSIKLQTGELYDDANATVKAAGERAAVLLDTSETKVKEAIIGAITWTTDTTRRAAERTVHVADAVKDAVVNATSKAVDWTTTRTGEATNRVLDSVEDAGYAIRTVQNNIEMNTIDMMGEFISVPSYGEKVRLGVGFLTSFTSMDAVDVQDPIVFDPTLPILWVNGVRTTDEGARKVANELKIKYGVRDVGIVENDTHFFGLAEIPQILGHELGGIDITAIRTRDAIRQAVGNHGRVYIWAHSQGTAINYGGASLLTPAERSHVVFVGNGSQRYFPEDKFGFRKTINIRTERDKIPIVNDILKWVWLRPKEQDWVRIQRTPLMNWLGHDTDYYLANAPDLRKMDEQYAK